MRERARLRRFRISKFPMTKEHHNFFTVGTLRYDKKALWMLFFWLMWNDFSITLLEQMTSLTNILMRDRGASYSLIAAFGTMGGLLGMWINPLFSTWSDRLRTRLGRRRPILFFAVPLFALSLCAIPFMPDLLRHLMRFELLASILHLIPGNGEAVFIGLAGLVNGLFNAVVLAIFSYFYWDVVPEIVLGRFNSIAKIVTVAAGVLWNFCIIGYAEHHAKTVYIGVSLFCLAVYMLSLWRVKEGRYPPPEARKSNSCFEPFVAYFRDCFSHSYYLWIFIGTLFYQLGNLGGTFQLFYLRYDLGMDLTVTGWIQGMGLATATIFGVLLGYSVGSMIDRFKPIRVIPISFFIWSLMVLISFFYVRDKMSAAVMACVLNVNSFIFGVALSAVTVELFPREKIGQFCSAQAFFYQTLIMVLNPFVISPFFDWLKFNRAGYLWSAFFYFLAGMVSVKVYFNWKRKQQSELLMTAALSPPPAVSQERIV